MHCPDFVPFDGTFEPTYSGGRLEGQWLLEALGEFHESNLITDILYKVKGGKEANVYCCAAHPDTGEALLAAKVYRPEAFRAMKNDGLYRLGREERSADGKAIRDKRAQRAMHKRTAIGKAMRSASWINHEYGALCEVFDAGVAVPEPIAINERTILMTYLGDAARAAPTLHEADLDRPAARAAFDVVTDSIARMLETGHVHGDLSAYNILYHHDRPFIIDLPQTVDPHTHPMARELLRRDVDRVCDYFRRRGLDCDPAGLTNDLWNSHIRRA